MSTPSRGLVKRILIVLIIAFFSQPLATAHNLAAETSIEKEFIGDRGLITQENSQAFKTNRGLALPDDSSAEPFRRPRETGRDPAAGRPTNEPDWVSLPRSWESCRMGILSRLRGETRRHGRKIADWLKAGRVAEVRRYLALHMHRSRRLSAKAWDLFRAARMRASKATRGILREARRYSRNYANLRSATTHALSDEACSTPEKSDPTDAFGVNLESGTLLRKKPEARIRR